MLGSAKKRIPPPYDIGQALVAFLEAQGSGAFRLTNDIPEIGAPGTGSEHLTAVSALSIAMAFLVRDGRIQHAPSEFSRYVGGPIGAFLSKTSHWGGGITAEQMLEIQCVHDLKYLPQTK
jgi:hypothetical protein